MLHERRLELMNYRLAMADEKLNSAKILLEYKVIKILLAGLIMPCSQLFAQFLPLMELILRNMLVSYPIFKENI